MQAITVRTARSVAYVPATASNEESRGGLKWGIISAITSKDRRNLGEGANDGEVGDHVDLSELLVDHEAEDAHHGGAAVVELDSTLEGLGLLIEGVPAEVEGTVTEVSGELSLAGDVLHDAELKEANEDGHLDNASGGDGVGANEGGNAVGEGGEGVSGLVNASGKVDSGAGDELAEEGKHADTSVLDLDVTEAVETLLVSIVEESEGIEESKRGLDTEGVLTLEGTEGGGGLGNLGRREGGGGGGEGGGDDELHVKKRFLEIL